MNELKVFENEEFGKVRMAEIDGKPYFCGSDVASALGYKRPNDAVSAHCRATAKHSIPIEKLEYVSEKTGKNKSEVIRDGIDLQYETIKEKE